MEHPRIFLEGHWRPYAESRVKNEALMYMITITYRMFHFLSIQKRTLPHLRRIQLLRNP
ncbi:MAG: hypothetical protein MjAS7_0977 [Metallosphaera javensis (ex Sakai et al. 2022)]|nr:MAG: hypothetical protein MjAS7_0977 [Metallosphaera javensis (ex Sakai et al. 2022)]